jgi:hypothetical protein
MEHAEALALIEDAALEPGGLERLMSGDTSESAALAGHLAGCPECTTALAATRRTAEALLLVAAETPAVDLRARTLALVAEVGRPRGQLPAEGAGDDVPGGASAASARQATAGPRRRFVLVALGAAAVFALLAAGSFVLADMQGQLDRTRQEAAHLHDLYAEIETLLQQPTARLVALQTEAGTPAGALVLDPTSKQIAVLSDDLAPPPSGMEYRCWVEANGQRQAVGRMWFEGGLAYWAGKNEGIAAWPAGASFGVSLEEVDQPASGPAVLSGKL